MVRVKVHFFLNWLTVYIFYLGESVCNWGSFISRDRFLHCPKQYLFSILRDDTVRRITVLDWSLQKFKDKYTGQGTDSQTSQKAINFVKLPYAFPEKVAFSPSSSRGKTII